MQKVDRDKRKRLITKKRRKRGPGAGAQEKQTNFHGTQEKEPNFHKVPLVKEQLQAPQNTPNLYQLSPIEHM